MCRALLLVLLLCQGLTTHRGKADDEAAAGCRFPPPWVGSWFLAGHQERIVLDEDGSLGRLGTCHQEVDRSKYVLHNAADQCFQCFAMWSRHANVLQYKAGDCVSGESPEDGLCDILPDATLHTLVRLDGDAVPCPFSSPLHFTYKKGSQEVCGEPKSEVTECMRTDQVVLKFQACPDLRQTESREELLTCLATWPDDRDASQTFLVGTLDHLYRRQDEDRVRCYLYHETETGYQVAQSSDATCYGGLQSPTDGFLSFTFDRPVSEEAGCRFPQWATQMGRLLSFGVSHLYQFDADGGGIMYSNFSYVDKQSSLLSRTTCETVVEEQQGYIKMVARVVANCARMYKCLKLFRRTEDILEIQEGWDTVEKESACTELNFEERLTGYTTLLKEHLDMRPCFVSGVHNVTDLSLDGRTEACDTHGFSRINFKCDKEELIQFYKECPADEGQTWSSSSSYFCQGGWQEEIAYNNLPDPYADQNILNSFNVLGGYSYGRTDDYDALREPETSTRPPETAGNITVGYIVAKPSNRNSNAARRVCFIYTVINGTYEWTVDKAQCARNIRPGHEGKFRFNTTVLDTCGSSASLGPRRFSLPCLIIILCAALVQTCHLSF